MAPERAGVAEIFRHAGGAFHERREGRIDAGRLKVMADIEACRTAVLGGHMYACDGCGREHPLYNSCRNRHCPTCQGLAATVWDRLVALPDGYRGFQDERGRLWDVLWMAHYYALRASNSDRVTMSVLVRDIRKDLRDSNRPPRRHCPIVAIGGGDQGEAVITIMFPEDD